MIALVLGGTRSGKSEVAERLAAEHGDLVTYLATAPTDDATLTERIARHRARRPVAWRTVEVGADLTSVLAETRGVVLVDSLGAWVAAHDDMRVDAGPLLEALEARQDPTVLVSEEVGLSVHPPTDVGRAFVDALGALNQQVAAVADEVVLVVAGRELRLC